MCEVLLVGKFGCVFLDWIFWGVRELFWSTVGRGGAFFFSEEFGTSFAAHQLHVYMNKAL